MRVRIAAGAGGAGIVPDERSTTKRKMDGYLQG